MEQLSTDSVTVEVVGLRHSFEDVLAVNDVSLSIKSGEFITLLGPSGSGKTTLLRAVAGLLNPTAGRILIGGQDVTSLPPEKRNVGFVFQNYALFPHLSVFENIAFPLKLRKRSDEEIHERVGAVLDMVELSGLGGRKPDQLSGGQQQRVALARAIVFHPSVLLMDEPLGALDRRLREQVGIELRKLQHELRITTIYVTHDQEEAFTMSDRIAVMNLGSVLQMGTPEEIYFKPGSQFIAKFVGDLNRFEGEITETLPDHAIAKTAGLELHLHGGNFEKGPVVIGLRPESIIIDPAVDTPNMFNATVQLVVFLGAFRRIELTLDNGQQLVANIQSYDLDLVEGQTVKVGWQPGHCVVLSAEDDVDILGL